MPNRHIFTIFDKMEADGVFERNPANQFSRGPRGEMIYKGPVQFPKMVYHPQGLFRLTSRAEAIATPLGPKMVGEQRELINKIVETPEELAEARAAGWLETPGDALARNPGRKTGEELAAQSAPDPLEELAALRAKNAELEAKLAAASED